MSGIVMAVVMAVLAPSQSAFAIGGFSRCQLALTDIMEWLGEAVENSERRDAQMHEGRDTLKIRFGLSLKPGMVLLVDPVGLRREEEIKIPGKSPIRMVVQKVKHVHVHRGPTYISALLFNPQTGSVWVPHFMLVHHVLNEGSLRRSTVFSPDEIVSIGEKDSGPRTYKRFDGKGEIGLPPESLPMLGRFKGLDAEGNSVVEIQVRNPFDGLPPTKLVVPVADVKANVSGTANKLAWHIRRLAWVRPSISSGEIVRYRGIDGSMRPAKFIRLLGNYRTVEIATPSGKKKRLPRNQVFKMFGPEPTRTPKFAFSYMIADQGNPRGAFREFLDRAAAIVSHPDFSALGTRSKLFHLVKYVQLLVPWTEAGKRAEIAGLKTFTDITCAGAGVCRHSSTLLAIILAEAGVNVRLMEFNPPGKTGHQWVEADLPRADGSVETWVLDPTPVANGPQDILTIKEYAELAMQKPDSLPALFYLNPARRIVRMLQ